MSGTSWKLMALQESDAQKVQYDIVWATIDAETGGQNISGDNGRAAGYGQVWPLWHRDNFAWAANQMGLTIPSDNDALVSFTLSNDAYSMKVTVKTIKDFWTAANGDWDSFTKSYVGPGISQADYNRRLAIWNKYKDPSAPNLITSSSNTTQSLSNIQFSPTNYSIDGKTMKSGDILYGRRYRVIVGENGNNALDVTDMRCTFSVFRTMMMQPNYSQVCIYNLAPNTANTIIEEGMKIYVEAGYEGDQYGLIFSGDIIQPIREKEDAVTKKLTLVSLDGDRFMVYGFVNYSMYKGLTPHDVITIGSAKASIPSELGSISNDLSKNKLPRGKVVFGLAKDVLRQVAQSEKATFYIDHGKVNFVKATDLPKGEIIELSPKSGLINVPTQTQYGVKARCLLNPKIQLNSFVHISNDLIQVNQVQVGQYQQPLDAAGLYRVISVNHIGDTRGNDWYTEIDTITQSGYLPSLITNSSANPW